jgi:hypothetical protein
VDATELKWNDFKQNVELHRSYLELAIKLNMFYHAITGAILSFYFANPDTPRYALALPLLLSIALAMLFLWSAVLANGLRTHIRETALELGLKAYPEGIVLVLISWIFGGVLALVSVGLVCFLVSG